MLEKNILDNITPGLEKFVELIKSINSNDTINEIKKTIFKVNDFIANVLEQVSKINYEKIYNVIDTFSKMTIKEETITTYEALLNCLESDEYIFYRGESSSKYELIPSIYRDINSNTEFYDYKYLLNKYKNILSFTNKKMNYKFLSLMQHYGLNSPFIDFTKNPKIALYFSIYDKNTGLIKSIKNDVAIYKVKLLNHNQYITKLSSANSLIRKYNVQYISDVSKEISFEEISLDKIGAPDSYFIDIPTNDRIDIQEGLFLYLNNFMISKNGFICNKLNDDALIIKYIIPKDVINKNLNRLDILLNEYKYIYDVEKYLKYKSNKYNG